MIACASAGVDRIAIPEGVTRIPSYAFRYHSSLELISLPESVDRIDGYAFLKAPIASIEMSKHMSHIGVGAFER